MNEPASRKPVPHVGRRAPTVLSVVHAAERTGPPLVALRFLRWLRDAYPEWRVVTLALEPAGDLSDDLADLGPLIHFDRASDPTRSRLRHDLSQVGPIDVAHVHCAGSMHVAPDLVASGDPAVVLHLHELSVGLDLHLGAAARLHLGSAARWIAVSDGVAAEASERFALDPARVSRVWGFTEHTEVTPTSETRGRRRSGSPLIVLSSGVRHWRKAPELFARLAMTTRSFAPDLAIRFRWVGGRGGADLRALSGGAVEFVDHVPDLAAELAAADLFALTAREDAFPLVCVEAARAGLPIVTFDSGGAADLVTRSGGGVVVDYPDVAAMAREIVRLATDHDAAEAASTGAASFAARELTADARGPDIVDVLVAAIAEHAGRRTDAAVRAPTRLGAP